MTMAADNDIRQFKNTLFHSNYILNFNWVWLLIFRAFLYRNSKGVIRDQFLMQHVCSVNGSYALKSTWQNH